MHALAPWPTPLRTTPWSGLPAGKASSPGTSRQTHPRLIVDAFQHELMSFEDDEVYGDYEPLTPSAAALPRPAPALATELPGASPSAFPSGWPPTDFPSDFPSDFPTDFPTDLPTDFPTDLPTDFVPPSVDRDPYAGLSDRVADFGGAALSVRFAEGGLLAQAVGKGLPAGMLAWPRASGIRDLPAETLFAYGTAGGGDVLGGPLGAYFGLTLAFVVPMGSDFQADDPLRRATGLTRAELDKLLAGGFVVAASPDLDVSTLDSGTAPSGRIPVGVRILGDPAELRPLAQRLATALHRNDGLQVYLAEGEGRLALALSQSYADELVGDGSLGDQESFTDVIPDADNASSAIWFDATSREWSDVDPEDAADLDALGRVGVRWWPDGGLTRAELRLTAR